MTDIPEDQDAENYERLRRSAKDLIDHGVPPPSRGGNLNAHALQLLYERASNPDSAADALKLLHELQTYQVELDLLYEQLQANEHEMSEELVYYKSLYEDAPAAYLIVAKDGGIIEGNKAAGELFGESPQALTGQALSALLAPGQDGEVDSLLRKSAEPQPGPQDAENASVKLPGQRRLTINTKPAAADDSVLMILTDTTTHPASS